MKKSGTVGWALLAAYVVTWDLAAVYGGKNETLSSAFWRGVRHPIARSPVVAIWLLTTAHLFGVFPPSLDPYQVCGRQIDRCVRRVRAGRS